MKTRLVVYILFLFFLAIWLGSAFHDSISTNLAWYQDPITHINHITNHPVPGAVNTWVISTALLSLISITAFVFFIRYKGKGRMEVLSVISITLIILLSTFLYFVPTLIKIFDETSSYNNEELISLSHQWVVLNAIRLFLLMILFIVGLVGLVKIARQ
jgi:hypothetical protein